MAIVSQPPKLLDQVRQAIRLRHYSPRTEESYVGWIRGFILFHHKRHPRELSEVEVSAFLSHLAEVRRVSASTQNQALSALLFLYRHVLRQEFGQLAPIVRAKRSEHLPVVLTRDEVRAVLHRLDGVMWLAVSVLYGAGLRLSECLGLRVKDLDFATGQIVVRSGKGGKDRVTPLPAGLTTPLSRHLERVRRVHIRDLASGFGRVALPEAIVRKYPTAAVAWGWQFVFPAARLCRDPRWGPAVTTCTNPSCSGRWRGWFERPPPRSGPAPTACDIRLQPICSRTAMTSGRCRNCSVIQT